MTKNMTHSDKCFVVQQLLWPCTFFFSLGPLLLSQIPVKRLALCLPRGRCEQFRCSLSFFRGTQTNRTKAGRARKKHNRNVAVVVIVIIIIVPHPIFNICFDIAPTTPLRFDYFVAPEIATRTTTKKENPSVTRWPTRFQALLPLPLHHPDRTEDLPLVHKTMLLRQGEGCSWRRGKTAEMGGLLQPKSG